jgi:hypothetical protein
MADSPEQDQINLEQLREYKQMELDIVSEAEAQRYQIESQFAELTRRSKEDSLVSEITAMKSASGTMAKTLGSGIKEQAMLMIPFELAEATKDMGMFLSTKDPSYLLASLKHALAIKQYADAAKSSAPSAGGASAGGAGGNSDARLSAPKAEAAPPNRNSSIVVNMGDGVITQPKEFVRQLVSGLNEAYQDNVDVEFA